jgi:hypothetical protein
MGDIEFMVKCPSKPALGDFKLRVPANATVGDVKRRLQESYPGAPEPSSITVGLLVLLASLNSKSCGL